MREFCAVVTQLFFAGFVFCIGAITSVLVLYLVVRGLLH